MAGSTMAVSLESSVECSPLIANPAVDTEMENLKDLSVILRSNVFPGSSHTTDEWCSVAVYPDHKISPETQVGIYMKPRKDYRRKVHQYSRWMEKDIETKNLDRQWNAYQAESRKKP